MEKKEERMPQSGEFYRHFKNKLYQVLTIATHSETGEKLVIYQALYGDFQVYARPLSMFVSEVDHEKYPQAVQKYRFEKIELRAGATEQTAMQEPDGATERTVMQEPDGMTEWTVMQEPDAVDASAGQLEERIHPKVLAFLDADDLQEQYEILVSLRDEIDDQMINTLSVVLDVVIPDGKLLDRYEALKKCVRTRQKYENTRLR